MFCIQCGTNNDEGSRYCSNCGAQLYSVPFTKNEEPSPSFQGRSSFRRFTANLPDEKELREFVGPQKAEYYLERWSCAENPEIKAGFNWAAFFLSVYWLGYRKMYGMLLLYAGSVLILDYIIHFVLHSSTGMIINFIFPFMFGFYGNALYLKFARRKIAQAKNEYTNSPYQLDAIKKAGGTAAAGVFISLGVILVFGLLEPGVFIGNNSYTTLSTKVASSNTSSNTTWNTSELDISKNGNLPLGIDALNRAGDIKQMAESPEPQTVYKTPWNFYGKVVSLTGTVAIVQDYPPDSQEAKALGGNAAEMAILTDDGTYVDFIMVGSSGDVQAGDTVTVYGFPIGHLMGENMLGGQTEELSVVGNDFDNE